MRYCHYRCINFQKKAFHRLEKKRNQRDPTQNWTRTQKKNKSILVESCIMCIDMQTHFSTQLKWHRIESKQWNAGGRTNEQPKQSVTSIEGMCSEMNIVLHTPYKAVFILWCTIHWIRIVLVVRSIFIEYWMLLKQSYTITIQTREKFSNCIWHSNWNDISLSFHFSLDFLC